MGGGGQVKFNIVNRGGGVNETLTPFSIWICMSISRSDTNIRAKKSLDDLLNIAWL